uniref:Uncharacterized protein n=1 Tax=Gasterosteus aculeatus TaxID=69293 RepID=G3N708_GASAC
MRLTKKALTLKNDVEMTTKIHFNPTDHPIIEGIFLSLCPSLRRLRLLEWMWTGLTAMFQNQTTAGKGREDQLSTGTTRRGLDVLTPQSGVSLCFSFNSYSYIHTHV